MFRQPDFSNLRFNIIVIWLAVREKGSGKIRNLLSV